MSCPFQLRHGAKTNIVKFSNLYYLAPKIMEAQQGAPKAVTVSNSSETTKSSCSEDAAAPPAVTQRPAGKFDVLIQGVALFSDGYNIQIIGYMNTVLAKLYPNEMTSEVKTRLSNSILIGDVFGMLLFGLCIDKFGRRVGIILTTLFLVFGIILATASHGNTVEGMFWMMVVGRGVAGVGAGRPFVSSRLLLTNANDSQHTDFSAYCIQVESIQSAPARR